MSVILETPRLVLRELSLDDLDFIADLLAHPEVMHFWPKPYSRDEAEAWIRRQQERYTRDGYGYWLALDKASKQPIGQAGLLRQDVDGVIEVGIGYIIHRPFWRQGYATEAAAHCRDYAFETLRKQRIVVLARPENVVSQSVARRIGGKSEREINFAGFVHTVFAISRVDWELAQGAKGNRQDARSTIKPLSLPLQP